MLGRAELLQDFHVARIGGLAIEDVMSQWRATEFLAQERMLHELQSGASLLLADLGREQTQLTDSFALGIQGRQQLAKRTREQISLERIDLVHQELADRFQRVLQRLRN